MWWIVVGVVVLAIVVLLAALATLAGRLRPMGRAMRRMSLRAEQAEKLQTKITDMQQKIVALQDSAEQAAARAGRGKAGRTPSEQ